MFPPKLMIAKYINWHLNTVDLLKVYLLFCLAERRKGQMPELVTDIVAYREGGIPLWLQMLVLRTLWSVICLIKLGER